MVGTPNYPDITSDKYVIVVNEDCDEVLDDGGEGDTEMGTLHIIKVIDNSDGGSRTASDFSFQVNDGPETAFEADGSNDIVMAAGDYTVTEVETSSRYRISYSDGCTGTLAEDGEATCTITNTYRESSSGGGGSSNRNNNNNDNDGEVLGASDSNDGEVLGAVCPAITMYMRQGMATDPTQVTALQAFLNGELGLNLAVNGIFDTLTTQAVNAFQLKYKSEVLAPWAPFGFDPNTPSGYVFKTTLWKINDIACPDLNVAFPTLP
jgi:peptidoglycan hydrolase-like protein with peptidoglycan-binding domain